MQSILISVLLNFIAGVYIGKASTLVTKNTSIDKYSKSLKLMISMFTIVVLYSVYIKLTSLLRIQLNNESKLIIAWIVFNSNPYITSMLKEIVNWMPPSVQ